MKPVLYLLIIVCIIISCSGISEDERLAFQGDAEAQYRLALKYHNGDKVETDLVEAVKWYTLAAEQGNAHANLGLALCYMRGEGVRQDDVKAYVYLNLTRMLLGDRHHLQQEVENTSLLAEGLLTANQIKQAKQEAESKYLTILKRQDEEDYKF